MNSYSWFNHEHMMIYKGLSVNIEGVDKDIHIIPVLNA